MTKLSVQHLKLDKIKPDENQPRKSFDQDHLNGLAESIDKHGVIQPITVRAIEDGYMIVAGERRYRACKQLGKKTIPAIVRQIKDNDILEIQIIENLQRQDVEPIEEAEAIAYLGSKHKPEEISKRIGRSLNFVYQRIKLGELIDGFKPYIRNKQLSLGIAIKAAAYPKEEQESFLEQIGDDFSEWQLRQLVDNQACNLQKAPFPLDDETLHPTAGACSLCPFNTANQGNLFGEDKQVCTKGSCFQTKKNLVLTRLLTKAKSEDILFIPDIRRYNMNTEKAQAIFKVMEQHGFTIYLEGDVHLVEKPIEPSLEEIRAENSYRDLTEEELQELYEEEVQYYRDEQQDYNEAMNKGYKKAMYFHSYTYQCVEALALLDDADGEQETTVSVESKKMDECTPKEKIIKIKQREERKKQIQNNKLFEEISNNVKESDYVSSAEELTKEELVAFCLSALSHNVQYYDKEKHFAKTFPNQKNQNTENFIKKCVKDFNMATFNKIIRYMILNQLHFGEQNHTNNNVNQSFYLAIQHFMGEEISNIETTYQIEEAKREERIAQRIAELEETPVV
ncbi:ParB/RepB/Spo0J family partition protein [Aquimarina mytili]|uniref:ParB/RepB/Spo0J family partition protein n=1 Tax=Aquimarina mytili TaxID=874423 RepID=A0A936ZVB4_9FLAO|nr:ParB/RepB/Spo0J family partition protein [Aquimarina mytili]MBL0686057.1 ParB/RepB/Spo0J family partition protein [Aquimarina mytili]